MWATSMVSPARLINPSISRTTSVMVASGVTVPRPVRVTWMSPVPIVVTDTDCGGPPAARPAGLAA